MRLDKNLEGMIGAWRGMGDPRVASPILCEGQHRLGLAP
jgi:hypothetical protein